MAAATPQCGSQQGSTAMSAAAEGTDQSSRSNSSDSRGWGVRRSGNAGRLPLNYARFAWNFVVNCVAVDPVSLQAAASEGKVRVLLLQEWTERSK